MLNYKTSVKIKELGVVIIRIEQELSILTIFFNRFNGIIKFKTCKKYIESTKLFLNIVHQLF